MVLPEYLSGEDVEVRALSPAVSRQPRLARQVLEHRPPIPALLGGHVWEKHRLVRTLFEDHTMLPDLDGLRPRVARVTAPKPRPPGR